MVIKRDSLIREKKLRKNLQSIKFKTAKQLTSKDKDEILIYLAKKFNLIKQD